jgi:3-oxoacyl-[acyl-carrier protein] reductase
LDRVAIVTGGAKGIGAGIVRRLARSYAVAVNYATSGDEANALVQEIEAGGGRAVAIQADVSDAAQAERMVAETMDALGPVCALVNNAAIHNSRTVLKLDPSAWDRAISVNLSGAFYCTHYALPAMYDAGWGRVVFIGTGVQRVPFPGDAAYAAPKAGLAAMANCMALETYAYGITVNTVIPGFVDTDMTRGLAPHLFEQFKRTVTEVTPDDVGAVVEFLCSEDAGAVNGEIIGAQGAGQGVLKRRDESAAP